MRDEICARKYIMMLYWVVLMHVGAWEEVVANMICVYMKRHH